jgi:outer membrane immunogenic protein
VLFRAASQGYPKGELLFFPEVSGSFATTNTISAGGVVTTLVLNSNYSSRITDNVLRVGLNYRFGGPVVAKY